MNGFVWNTKRQGLGESRTGDVEIRGLSVNISNPQMNVFGKETKAFLFFLFRYMSMILVVEVFGEEGHRGKWGKKQNFA